MTATKFTGTIAWIVNGLVSVLLFVLWCSYRDVRADTCTNRQAHQENRVSITALSGKLDTAIEILKRIEQQK